MASPVAAPPSAAACTGSHRPEHDGDGDHQSGAAQPAMAVAGCAGPPPALRLTGAGRATAPAARPRSAGPSRLLVLLASPTLIPANSRCALPRVAHGTCPHASRRPQHAWPRPAARPRRRGPPGPATARRRGYHRLRGRVELWASFWSTATGETPVTHRPQPPSSGPSRDGARTTATIAGDGPGRVPQHRSRGQAEQAGRREAEGDPQSAPASAIPCCSRPAASPRRPDRRRGRRPTRPRTGSGRSPPPWLQGRSRGAAQARVARIMPLAYSPDIPTTPKLAATSSPASPR